MRSFYLYAHSFKHIIAPLEKVRRAPGNLIQSTNLNLQWLTNVNMMYNVWAWIFWYIWITLYGWIKIYKVLVYLHISWRFRSLGSNESRASCLNVKGMRLMVLCECGNLFWRSQWSWDIVLGFSERFFFFWNTPGFKAKLGAMILGQKHINTLGQDKLSFTKSCLYFCLIA